MKWAMIKEWLLDKMQTEARRYNIFIDTPERTDDVLKRAVVHDDGTVKVIVEEFIAETEKAVKVRFSSGAVIGSAQGWTAWVPKSAISVMEA